MTRRKLIWTALLIAATCAVVAAGPFLRPYLIAKYWGAGADLHGAYLVRAPLSGVDLLGANLDGTRLRHADLRNAVLGISTGGGEMYDVFGAGMPTRPALATLRSADLRWADLSGANLGLVDLTGSIRDGANFSGANMEWADMRAVSAQGADFSGAFLWKVLLSQASLPNADLHASVLGAALLCEADLRYADLSDADLEGAFLLGSDLSYADLSGANLSRAILEPSALDRYPTLSPVNPECLQAPAILTATKYDAYTRWPEDFDPVAAGAVLVE